MAINKRLLVKPPGAGGITPSEHFGVVLYEGDGTSSHSINGGKFGAAVYYQSGNVITHGLSGPTEMSLSIWVNAANFSSNSWDNTDFWIFSVGADAAAGNITALMFSSINDGYLKFARNSNDGGAITSSVQMSANTWNHCVFTYTGGNSAKIYLNGSQVASGTFTTTQTSTINPGGANNFGGPGPTYHLFEGKLDQARVFYKELSSSEVSTLYAETAPESLDPLSEDTTDTLQVLGDSSCIATYRFENDETDLSGNYDFTSVGGVQYAAGRYGQGVHITGASGDSSYLTATNPVSQQAFSVSFWTKYTESTLYTSHFGLSDGTSDPNFFINTQASGAIACAIYDTTDGSSGFAGYKFNFTHSTTGLNDGNWHHVAFSWDGSTTTNAVKLYIDNVVNTGTSSRAASNIAAFNEMTVGVPRSSNTDYWNVKIDQLRVFNKAISASEVTTLYNENSLVASYRFEGNANDDTRNYDGTASNVSYEYGLNFTPDLVWIKERGPLAENHNWIDSTRGTNKVIASNSTGAEFTSTRFTSFDAGGFTLANNNETNDTGTDYVAWCLKANGGTTSTNTDGSNTSTVQVNEQAGFSIVQGTSSGGYPTVNSFGHGLGTTPALIIIKQTNGIAGWPVWHQSFSNTAQDYLILNNSNAKATSSEVWGNSAPTSSVFSITDGWTLNVGGTFIAYCFAEVENFSKFGSYTGTGTTQSIETGFEVEFLLIKGTSFITDWMLYDKKRSGKNYLIANSSAAEGGPTANPLVTFLSNGFQVHTSNSENKSGETFIYMAFAADPDTEAPTVAKSFTTVAYTGTGSARSIDGLGFSPSLVWIKSRTNLPFPINHTLSDSVRGSNSILRSNLTNAETIASTEITSFDSNGFSLGTGASVNFNNDDLVAWAWKADDNEPTINTEGTIDSIVSANANAGFSIVKYIGDGLTSLTSIGHGLSAAPELIIQKSITNPSTYGTSNWRIGGTVLGGAGKYMYLNLTNAVATNSNEWGNTQPDATKFYVSGTAERSANESGIDYINYCFHSVSGYSKIGSYTGTGTTNSITGLGFQPDFLLVKRTSGTGVWVLYDSVRGGDKYLIPDLSASEGSNTLVTVNFTSDGFTFPSTSTSDSVNFNGDTYIYMAFKIN